VLAEKHYLLLVPETELKPSSPELVQSPHQSAGAKGAPKAKPKVIKRLKNKVLYFGAKVLKKRPAGASIKRKKI